MESFRDEIEAAVLTPDEARKSSAGMEPLDAAQKIDRLEYASKEITVTGCLGLLRKSGRNRGTAPLLVSREHDLEVAEALEWQPHTVRVAMAGALKKKLGLASHRKRMTNAVESIESRALTEPEINRP